VVQLVEMLVEVEVEVAPTMLVDQLLPILKLVGQMVLDSLYWSFGC